MGVTCTVYSFWYKFGSISEPFPIKIRWNLKLRYWNLKWLGPKLLRSVGTKTQKSWFFRYLQFWPNPNPTFYYNINDMRLLVCGSLVTQLYFKPLYLYMQILLNCQPRKSHSKQFYNFNLLLKTKLHIYILISESLINFYAEIVS